MGQHQRAIQDYDDAIRLDPMLALAYNNRGFTYENLSQYQRAIQDYDQAIRFDPQLPIAYANRAGAYTLLNMDAEAQQDIQRAVELGIDRTLLNLAIEELKRQR